MGDTKYRKRCLASISRSLCKSPKAGRDSDPNDGEKVQVDSLEREARRRPGARAAGHVGHGEGRSCLPEDWGTKEELRSRAVSIIKSVLLAKAILVIKKANKNYSRENRKA